MAITLFLFPSPPSLFVNSMSILNLLALIGGGYMELIGKNKQYAKFYNPSASNTSNEKEKSKLSSRIGMLVFYTPSFFLGVASFSVFRLQDLRFLMAISVLTFHFFKRIFEVLFVHKFSGSMMVDDAITIGLSYFVSTATMIYAQYLSQESPEPAYDLKYVGLAMFLTGISGNFYHHYILSSLRRKGDREYKVPKGGLFDLVICPHYLFEIIEFVGVTCIYQTGFTFCFTLGTVFLLMGRSYATRKWYVTKFGGKFGKNVKALIPYLF
ncbi:hypothetical protein LXL04_012785 [Taraxacum kok-saghyz]